MSHTKVLKQAWHTMWNYRALWIFGVILALTTSSWGMSSFLDRDNDEYQRGITVTTMPGETFYEVFQRTMQEEIKQTKREINEANRDLDRFFAEVLHIDARSDLLTFITVLAWVMVIVYIIARVARYVGETALIRMVDGTEETGKQIGVRQGAVQGKRPRHRVRQGGTCRAGEPALHAQRSNAGRECHPGRRHPYVLLLLFIGDLHPAMRASMPPRPPTAAVQHLIGVARCFLPAEALIEVLETLRPGVIHKLAPGALVEEAGDASRGWIEPGLVVFVLQHVVRGLDLPPVAQHPGPRVLDLGA